MTPDHKRRFVVDKITTTMIAGIGLFTGELALAGSLPAPVGMLALVIVGLVLHALLRQQA